MDGVRVRDGVYRVVFGPQAIMEILQGILLPSLHLDTFHAGASTFQGKLTRTVASELLNLYDDGARPGYAASKSITDEGQAGLRQAKDLLELLAESVAGEEESRDAEPNR